MKIELNQTTNRLLSGGSDSPLGATPNESGTNFTVYSQHAEAVYLLLFDGVNRDPTDIIGLEKSHHHIWHIFVHGIGPDQLYGYKVRGRHDPGNGYRFNEHKLLIDPYAKALSGTIRDDDRNLSSPSKDLSLETRDNTHIVPKSIVVKDNTFLWQGDEPPNTSMEDLVIYEVHLKGFTAHASSGVSWPGTYLGFIEKIPYLKDLGITAVEFLPIFEPCMRYGLTQKGLVDYWAYNTIGFFAPAFGYSSRRHPGCQIEEFKTLVRELHREGIEVILDVVYNHTGEGNELGATVCYRGIDNPTYYRLQGPKTHPHRFYQDFTGTGNTFNIEHPRVQHLVFDSLRYWVKEMHVDGFRFDLAPVLGLKNGAYHVDAPFFKVISQDPVLSRIKLIAEPWDATTNQMGNFPTGWLEWNGKFRDTVRRFLIGQPGQIRDLGWRLTGSQDLFQHNGRTPLHSINFISCHDGFTLHDLYTYNNKHNEHNFEDNRDGADENKSWNCGIEGRTDREEIMDLRTRMMKNAICLLVFSLGTPMILGGDEFGRTQEGNNNAYCQDNDMSWFDWTLLKRNADLFQFTQKAIAFRKHHPVLRKPTYFQGRDMNENRMHDIQWYGKNTDPLNWENPSNKLICYLLDGSESPAESGNDYLFFILNSDKQFHNIKIPHVDSMDWYRVVDTNLKHPGDFANPGKELPLSNANIYQAMARSVIVLLARQNSNQQERDHEVD